MLNSGKYHNSLKTLVFSESLNFESDEACRAIAQIVANSRQLKEVKIDKQCSEVRTVKVQIVAAKKVEEEHEPAMVKVIDAKTEMVVCQEVRATEQEIKIVNETKE